MNNTYELIDGDIEQPPIDENLPYLSITVNGLYSDNPCLCYYDFIDNKWLYTNEVSNKKFVYSDSQIKWLKKVK